MIHQILFPYFCEEEVERFRRIAQLIRKYPKPKAKFSFLMVAAKEAGKADNLAVELKSIASVEFFQSSVGGNAYPYGPRDMFWEVMEYVDSVSQEDKGFALWMESDMVPINPNWLDRMDVTWRHAKNPIVIGMYVTNFPEHLGGKPIPHHLNGGACYAKDLIKFIPKSVQEEIPFDLKMFPAIKASGRPWYNSNLFAFASPEQAQRPQDFPDISILHGIGTGKDEFMDNVMEALESSNKP